MVKKISVSHRIVKIVKMPIPIFVAYKSYIHKFHRSRLAPWRELLGIQGLAFILGLDKGLDKFCSKISTKMKEGAEQVSVTRILLEVLVSITFFICGSMTV